MNVTVKVRWYHRALRSGMAQSLHYSNAWQRPHPHRLIHICPDTHPDLGSLLHKTQLLIFPFQNSSVFCYSFPISCFQMPVPKGGPHSLTTPMGHACRNTEETPLCSRLCPQRSPASARVCSVLPLTPSLQGPPESRRGKPRAGEACQPSMCPAGT